jgi:hypothetical protein
LASDIPAGDWKIDNLCLQCIFKVEAAFSSTGDSVGFGQLPEQAKKSFLYFVLEFIFVLGILFLFM